MLDRLKRGLDQFQTKTYKENENLYHELSHQQHPHTLFISCSDSRISPERLMAIQPGEVFTIRNVANTVPSSDRSEDDFTTLSAIEYAVEVLEVEEIIVCGHSNCGGCGAILNGLDKISHLPYTKEYLKPLESVRDSIQEELTDKDAEEKAQLLEQANVVHQVNHLKEYPFITERLNQGKLEIEGWHYTIGSGSVSVYNESENKFVEFDEN